MHFSAASTIVDMARNLLIVGFCSLTAIARADEVDRALAAAHRVGQMALAAPQAERELLWQQAEQPLTEILQAYPEHPRRILVEVQRALLTVARGKLALGIGQLKACAEAVDAEVAGRALHESHTSTLTDAELAALSGNLRFQLGRAYQQQARTFPTDSADRDNSLLEAMRLLERQADKLSSEPGVWDARVEVMRVYRALRLTDRGTGRLHTWIADAPTSKQKDDLRAAWEEVPDANIPANSATSKPRLTAAEVHRLKIISQAQQMRDRDQHANGFDTATYRRLLNEHLATWPDAPTAREVQQWAGQLAVAEQRWEDVARLIDAHELELELTDDQQAALDRFRIESRSDRRAAVRELAALVEQNPHDGDLRESYARRLADSRSVIDRREAIAVWREVEQLSRPQGKRWWRARRARITLLRDLGDPAGEKLKRLTELLQPQ